MFKLIGVLVVLALGATGTWAWDRHPPWGVHIPVLFWHVGFDLPDSLAVQRDKAIARAQAASTALDVCHADTQALDWSLQRQNAAVEALQREGDARTAESARAVSGARAVAASERRHAQDLLDAQRGAEDACAAADALILKEASR